MRDKEIDIVILAKLSSRTDCLLYHTRKPCYYFHEKEHFLDIKDVCKYCSILLKSLILMFSIELCFIKNSVKLLNKND